MKTIKFVVRVPHIPGVSLEDWRSYIKESVKGWNGAYPPDHPLMGALIEKVKVTRKAKQ